MEAFQRSDIIFQKSHTSVPFPPLAFLQTSHYGDAAVDSSGRGVGLDYDVTITSQAAAVPFLINSRSAMLVGEYVSHARFHVKDVEGQDFPELDDKFTVNSIGIPIGWMYQNSPKWQTVAFVMPMTHQSSLSDSDRSWQYLMGAFGRYLASDDSWWVYGVYADVSEGDDFVVPYVGAYWTVNENWSISAIMPWPSITYNRGPDWFVRLGVAPSSASWSIAPDSGDAAINYDAWDFGLSFQKRVTGGLWMNIQGGIGGFRGVRVERDSLEAADLDVSSSPFVRLEINYRPSVK